MVIALDYNMSEPTAFDHLKENLAQILNIGLSDQADTKRKTE